MKTENNIPHPDHGTTSVDAVTFYDDLWANTNRVDQHHKCRILAIERALAKLSKKTRTLSTFLNWAPVAELLQLY